MNTSLEETQQDRDDLRGLALFHYMMSGFAALVAIAAFVYAVIATYWPAPGMPPGFSPPADESLVRFVALRAALVGSALAMIVLALVAGRCLNRRRWYRFCVAVAVVECFFTPFGTLLGVVTIMVLRRASVKRTFAAMVPGPGAAVVPGRGAR